METTFTAGNWNKNFHQALSNEVAKGMVRVLGIAVFCLLGMAGCSNAGAPVYPGEGEFQNQAVLIAGSQEYNDAVAKLAITPDQAIESAKHVDPGVHRPSALIGHTYVFSAYATATYIPLTGMYVDGDSGNARHVDSEYVVRINFGKPTVTLHG